MTDLSDIIAKYNKNHSKVNGQFISGTGSGKGQSPRTAGGHKLTDTQRRDVATLGTAGTRAYGSERKGGATHREAMAHAKYIDKTPPNKRPDRIKETRRPSKKAKSDSKASGGKKVSRKPTDLNEEKAIRSGRGKSARDTKGSLGGDAERGLRGLAPKQKKMLAGIEAGNYTPGSARSVVQTLVRQAKIAMGKAERMREYSGGEGAAEQDRKALDALAAAQHLNGKYKLGYPVPKN